ncbi:MAG: hypothetical protein J6D03_04310 [Clostridia bacterium]|nr:hypothetical protein [Clostridia bacterium]
MHKIFKYKGALIEVSNFREIQKTMSIEYGVTEDRVSYVMRDIYSEFNIEVVLLTKLMVPYANIGQINFEPE